MPGFPGGSWRSCCERSTRRRCCHRLGSRSRGCPRCRQRALCSTVSAGVGKGLGLAGSSGQVWVERECPFGFLSLHVSSRDRTSQLGPKNTRCCLLGRGKSRRGRHWSISYAARHLVLDVLRGTWVTRQELMTYGVLSISNWRLKGSIAVKAKPS